MWEYNYDYISHHGILGQKWGVRRFQNPDGTLTTAGKRRYGAENVESISSAKGIQRRLNDLDIGMAYNTRDRRDNIKKHNKYFQKGGKRLQKNVDKLKEGEEKQLVDKKVINLFGKAAKYKNKYELNERNMEEGTKETLRLLEVAKNNGYDMTVKDIERYAQRSIDAWGQAAFGLAGVPITVANVKKNSFAGKQYEVKDKNNTQKLLSTMDEPGITTKKSEFRKTVLQNDELQQFIKDHPQPSYGASEKERLKANKEFKDAAMDLVYKIYGKDVAEQTGNSSSVYNSTLASKIVSVMYSDAIDRAGKQRYGFENDGDSKGYYVDKNPKLRAMYQKAISAKTDEEKDVLMRKYKNAQLVELAKTDDKWNTEFLEAIQNSKIFNDNDTKSMLKEYDKYLDDPEKYRKERAGKLTSA